MYIYFIVHIFFVRYYISIKYQNSRWLTLTNALQNIKTHDKEQPLKIKFYFLTIPKTSTVHESKQ